MVKICPSVAYAFHGTLWKPRSMSDDPSCLPCLAPSTTGGALPWLSRIPSLPSTPRCSAPVTTLALLGVTVTVSTGIDLALSMLPVEAGAVNRLASFTPVPISAVTRLTAPLSLATPDTEGSVSPAPLAEVSTVPSVPGISGSHSANQTRPIAP